MAKINDLEKIKLSKSALDATLTALLGTTPVYAARSGLLTLSHGAAEYAGPLIDDAVAPLCAELGVTGLDGLMGYLAGVTGRPPRALTRALRSRSIVDALARVYDEIGLYDRADQVRTWLVDDLRSSDLIIAEGTARADRAALAGDLLTRAAELLAGWRADSPKFSARGVPSLDGRVLVAAARAWQVRELSPATATSAPSAPSAKYANRLGRTAAAVAASRLGNAWRSPVWVPALAIEESLALLIAVAEAVSVPGSLAQVRRGDPEFSVRLGESTDTELARSQSAWWPILDSWGSTSRSVAGSIPTAWRLTDVQGDVVVWALCSAACRLAVAASVPTPQREGGEPVDPVLSWERHLAAHLPRWESGAESVWSLLNQGRLAGARSSWPGAVVPVLDDPASWPWRPFPNYDEPSTDTLAIVPVAVEEA
jgi:hypothetical protein